MFTHIGTYSRGRQARTVIDQLECDTGLSRQDLASAGAHQMMMANRREWDRLRISAGAPQR